MKLLRFSFPLLAALALTSCAVPTPPTGFLKVAGGGHELKAIAPDDSLYWLREFRDGMRGDFDFWSEALENEFVDQRGYTLLEKRSLQWNGVPGVEFLFEVTAAGRARRYLVTLATRRGTLANTIRVAEYVADKEVFEEHVAAVRAALGT